MVARWWRVPTRAKNWPEPRWISARGSSDGWQQPCVVGPRSGYYLVPKPSNADSRIGSRKANISKKRKKKILGKAKEKWRSELTLWRGKATEDAVNNGRGQLGYSWCLLWGKAGVGAVATILSRRRPILNVLIDVLQLMTATWLYTG